MISIQWNWAKWISLWTSKVLYNGLVTAEDYEVSKIFLFFRLSSNYLVPSGSSIWVYMSVSREFLSLLQCLGNVVQWVRYGTNRKFEPLYVDLTWNGVTTLTIFKSCISIVSRLNSKFSGRDEAPWELFHVWPSDRVSNWMGGGVGWVVILTEKKDHRGLINYVLFA